MVCLGLLAFHFSTKQNKKIHMKNKALFFFHKTHIFFLNHVPFLILLTPKGTTGFVMG